MQTPLTIYHKQVIRGLVVRPPRPQGLDGLLGSHLGAQGQEAVGHQAAGALVGVDEQRAHVVGRLAVHLGQHALLPLLGQIADHVGRVVRLHLIENLAQRFVVDAFGHGGLVILVHLHQNVGAGFGVEPGEQFGLIVEIELIEDFKLMGVYQRFKGIDGRADVVAIERVFNLFNDIIQLIIIQFNVCVLPWWIHGHTSLPAVHSAGAKDSPGICLRLSPTFGE